MALQEPPTRARLWLKIHENASGLRSLTYAEALDVALCWGWIDGQRKAFDERPFLQRYTPRKPKSMWSQIDRDHIARLSAAGRMTEHGQRQVDAAKADGRWYAADAPIRAASPGSVPLDLRKAIYANPRAGRTFASLNRTNLFALTLRINNTKSPAGRAMRLVTLVEMQARGEVMVPLAARRKSARQAPPR